MILSLLVTHLSGKVLFLVSRGFNNPEQKDSAITGMLSTKNAVFAAFKIYLYNIINHKDTLNKCENKNMR
ncbi:hypothetical protein AB832_01295 [Flavobacteriaceae bacterium (ex Bugula neritina AB1)]|nr:hypothetical protein AB832_01295 [Flavobacteriaceae bacterium (ex Bugula neritina AB1)]